MATFKLLNLLAAITLALVAVSLSATPVNALSTGSGTHVVRHLSNHASIHKKKRDSRISRRCKPRPSGSAQPTSGAPQATPPTDNQPDNNSDNNGGGSGSDDNTSDNQAPPPSQTPTSSPSPTPSPTPAPSPPSPPPSSGGRKAGLGWAQNDDTALSHMAGPDVGYVYTWSPWCPPNANSLGLICCPMLWGGKQANDFQQIVTPGYATIALGMNEPNEPSQSNLSPQDAANMWQTYIQPLAAQGYKLITPACTNAPDAIQWYQDFFAACTGCTFDGLATHYYGIDPVPLINFLQTYYNTFGLEIWLTEFACEDFGGADPTMDQVWYFMQTVKSYLDGASLAGPYFAFGALYDMANVSPLNQLLGPDGNPTALGNYYIGNN